jgi:hypothetical protein
VHVHEAGQQREVVVLEHPCAGRNRERCTRPGGADPPVLDHHRSAFDRIAPRPIDESLGDDGESWQRTYLRIAN